MSPTKPPDDFGWIDIFNGVIAPAHRKYGIGVTGAWANREDNLFVWVRSFESEDDMREKMRSFTNSPERHSLGHHGHCL